MKLTGSVKQCLKESFLKFVKSFTPYSAQYIGQNILFKKEKKSINYLEKHYRYMEQMSLSIILNKLNISGVIDVGANEGQFAERIQATSYKGSIYSFEPLPNCYQQLSHKAEGDSNWKTFQMALGSGNGTTDLNVTDGSKFSSVHSPNEYAAKRFGDWVEVKDTEEVMIRRLDTVLSHIPSEERLYLKMDTQGYDLQVFRGAEGLMDQIICVQSELAWRPLYEDMPLWRETMDELEGEGYSLVDLWPISKDRASYQLVEADGLFVRDEINSE